MLKCLTMAWFVVIGSTIAWLGWACFFTVVFVFVAVAVLAVLAVLVGAAAMYTHIEAWRAKDG